MSLVNIFDANCMVGRHLTQKAGDLCTPAELLDDMDHYGIAEALVVDSLSRQFHPGDGNCHILKLVAEQPRLHPAWVILPPGLDAEQPPAEQFIEQMRRHHVPAVFLYVRQYSLNLSDWSLDGLLEPLAAAGIPLFVNFNQTGGPGPHPTEQIDWEGLLGLCRRWPKLPVILTEDRIRRQQRTLFRALEACPNLRVELSALWLDRNIELIVQHWGAHRLLFGSNWPVWGPHMTLAMLNNADINPSQRRQIAGDNLRGLLAWCGPQHPAVEEKPPADDFVAWGRGRRKDDSLRVWDCHGHLGGSGRDYHVPGGDLDSTVKEMDRHHIEKTCVFAFAGIFGGDERYGNDTVAEAVRRFPDRFVGFTLLNPHRGKEEMLAELRRGAQMGLRGVKLIAWYQGYPEDGPLIDVACRWAHEHRQIILNHGWGPAENVKRLVGAYPNACFLTGHTTTAYAQIMKEHPNLHICTCPLLGPRDCERFVALVGADRLLFGSDLQDLPIAWGLGPILFARIPPEQKRLILGGNLRRLLQTYSLEENQNGETRMANQIRNQKSE